jgi:hypothetical protein
MPQHRFPLAIDITVAPQTASNSTPPSVRHTGYAVPGPGPKDAKRLSFFVFLELGLA